jgi:hypothetical protein
MTQPLTGLSAIANLQTVVDEQSQATPEMRMGGTADPAHGTYLVEPTIPRGSRMGTPVGPLGAENQLLGEFDSFVLTPAGNEYQDPYFDHTPTKRAGPWPKGIASGPIVQSPDHTAMQLQQSYGIHGIETNASAHANHNLDALNDDWQVIEQTNPGHTDVSTVPNQMKSSGFAFGTRDRVQSFARQNEYGFDSAHQHRRFADARGIPGNYMYLQPGGRPLVKTLAGPARPPIGPNSPFTGDDLGATFGIDGAILQNVPSEYVGPPQPTLGPSLNADVNDSVVEWY